MATNINYATSFSSDIEAYIAEKVLPLTQKQLVLYQFGDKATLPKNRGTTYTASRYSRVPLPFAALSEGVPATGETLSLSQVTATAQQWGDLIEITDVGELTIKHDLFKQAMKLTAMQLGETYERNTNNTLMTGTNVIIANSKVARVSLAATDVMTVTEINKAAGSMLTTGVPMFDGTMEEDVKIDANRPVRNAPKEHYVAVMHPLASQDLLANSTIVTAFSYSQIERLYTNELGEWAGFRFTRSNMVPTFTGLGATTGYAYVATGGVLAAGTYSAQVTGVNKITGYEEKVAAVATAATVTGVASSITVVLPTDTTYLYNIYLDNTATVAHLAKTVAGPATGGLAGMSVQLPASATVTLTALGTAQTPPAAPASLVTVIPTYWIGKGAYTIVSLDNARFFYLRDADKSDPQNQLRIVSWKVFYGTLINNQAFLLRTESSSAYTNAITNGTLN